MSQKDISREASISKNTIVDWANFCRESIEIYLANNPEQLGGIDANGEPIINSPMFWENKYNADGESDDEEYSSWVPAQRDGLVLLIDCHESMFESAMSDNMSPFGLCMKCAMTILQRKVISSDKDLVAVVFYRTVKMSSPDMKNVYVFQGLEQPSAQRILQLEDAISWNKSQFKSEIGGTSPTYSLYDALWSCQDLFNKSKFNIGHKRVFLFTNEDAPHSDSLQMRRQVQAKIRDFQENNVDLELFDLPKPDNSPFDIARFYKDLLFNTDEEFKQFPDTETRFEELLSRVRAKDNKKRAQVRIDLDLGGDVQLNVGVYNLVRRCAVPSAIKLESSSNEEVKPKLTYMLNETGEVLHQQDLAKAITFAGKKITFDLEEIKHIKSIAPQGLKLLGFKPLSDIHTYHHARPAQFLYPDEKVIEGSTTLFSALLSRCLQKKVFALCRYVPRRNTSPVLVALLPQAETKDEDGAQIAPPGFHLIFLPFADDLRKLELPKTERATAQQIDKAKALVNSLTMNYDPEAIENPHIQKFYANLEALALEREETDSVEDHTKPDCAMMRKRAAKALDDFKYFANLNNIAPPKKAAPSTSSKGLDNVDLHSAYQDGTLYKLTVPVLKEAIKKAKINCTGTKKADLISAVENHFQK